MDGKIDRIIKICRFEEDPSWPIMSALFNSVTFDKYYVILKNRDNLIKKLLDKAEARKIKSQKELEDSITIVDEKKIIINEPLLISGGLHFPNQNVHISKSPVYLGEGVTLSDVLIHTCAYISNKAKIEYSRLQSDNRYTFVGENTVISNVDEIRGCFISGGPLRDEGRKQIYLHVRSINNMIIGAYSGMSVGSDVFNHPIGDDISIVIDPETLKPHSFPKQEKYRKLPILVGVEAVIGAGSLLNSGSIIGAKSVVPNRSEVDGLVYKKMEGLVQIYIRAREKKKL